MSLPALQPPTPTALDFRGLTPATPISIECGEGVITMAVQDVINWIAPGAPIQDAMRFLMVCRNARLNPLLGEAYLLPMGKADPKHQVIIAKSGFLKRAQEHPRYDGHASGVTVWFQGDFVDIEGMIRPPMDGVPVVGGWSKVWRKGVERPVYKRVSLDEYRKGTHIWGAIPMTMIAKVALVAALREAFGLADSYDESELAYDLPAAPAIPAEVAPQARVDPPKVHVPELVIEPAPEATPVTTYHVSDTIGYVCPEMTSKILELLGEYGATEADILGMLARRNVQTIEQLTVEQGEEIIKNLQTLIREDEATEVFGPPEATPQAESVVLPEGTTRGEPADVPS